MYCRIVYLIRERRVKENVSYREKNRQSKSQQVLAMGSLYLNHDIFD